jgi:DNA-binding PadR family transcriptional regulator
VAGREVFVSTIPVESPPVRTELEMGCSVPIGDDPTGGWDFELQKSLMSALAVINDCLELLFEATRKIAQSAHLPDGLTRRMETELYSMIDILIIGSKMPKRKLDPRPSAAFRIMLALAESDLHGHAIMRPSGGQLFLVPGTSYGSIQSLLKGELIEEVDPAEDTEVRQERRRYYRLTVAGRKWARSEAEKMADVLCVARDRKILRGNYV